MIVPGNLLKVQIGYTFMIYRHHYIGIISEFSLVYLAQNPGAWWGTNLVRKASSQVQLGNIGVGVVTRELPVLFGALSFECRHSRSLVAFAAS